MAFFGITVEKIEKVWNHPNADRLSMAKVKGLAFQFVIGKDQFKENDTVLYFPLDSVVPEDLLKKMNMLGKLSGKNKNLVKTVKLRGELSQGLVFPSYLLSEEQLKLSPEEITITLGVTKYDPPVNMTQDCILKELPTGFSKYDIEGADRFGHIVELLLDQEVVITEKMEGTNCSVAKDCDSLLVVNQRSNTIIEKPGINTSYWKTARNQNLLQIVDSLPPISAIYGELCGPSIQKNIYQSKDHEIFVFDIKDAGKWMDWESFKLFTSTHGIRIAPVLFIGKLKDFLNGKSVQEASNGKSVINPFALREGIVIKPVVEQFHSQIGRLIVKQRSPEYLANES
jgi:RNA ligase (TIGR02306 family)